MNISRNTAYIKQRATALGFQYCGISKAEFLEEEAPRLEAWLKRNMHGTMSWMENHFDKRLDPRLLVDGAKSVISLLLNYTPEDTSLSEGKYKISRYAYGKDYHYVIKDKLKELLHDIQEEIGDVNGRVFVDSAPVMDKAWAKKSGTGWVGKNSNLITKEAGSYFFIAELIIDLELEADGPIKDYCGTCTKCIDACPTDAIAAPYVVDGSKCISYLTIELKDKIPAEFKNQMQGWAFGCDICQEVCPWNSFAQATEEAAFLPSASLKNTLPQKWEELTEEIFRELFRESAVSRTKWAGLQRNIKFLRESEES